MRWVARQSGPRLGGFALHMSRVKHSNSWSYIATATLPRLPCTGMQHLPDMQHTTDRSVSCSNNMLQVSVGISTITRSSNHPGDQPGRYHLDSVDARYGEERRLIGLMVKFRSRSFFFFPKFLADQVKFWVKQLLVNYPFQKKYKITRKNSFQNKVLGSNLSLISIISTLQQVASRLQRRPSTVVL